MDRSQLPGLQIGALGRLQTILRSADWVLAEALANRLEYWLPRGETRSDRGVVIPLDPSKGDYQRLYDEAWRTARRIVGESVFDRLSVEADAGSDGQFVRSSWSREAPTRPGTVPWLLGSQLFSSITRQLIAAAKSSVTPAPLLGRMNHYLAQEFLNATILAPSGSGSYVVNVLTPTKKNVYVSAPRETDTGHSVPRKSIEAIAVLATLDQALVAIEGGLEESREQDKIVSLTTSYGRGVSRELLLGLVEFATDGESEISLPRYAWSADPTARKYSFTPSQVPILQKAADTLSTQSPSSTVSLTGIVTKLEHEPSSERWSVRLFTTSRGPVRRVTLLLREADYDLALQSHSEDLLVRVTGELSKDGKFWTMVEPALQVLAGDDEDDESADDLMSVDADPGPAY